MIHRQRLLGAFAVVALACSSTGGPASDASTGDAPSEASDAASDVDAACAPATYKATKRLLVMEIVLDGTGSMQDNQKWLSCTSGLQAFIEAEKVAPNASFEAGLIVFSDATDPTNGAGPYPTSSDVAPQPIDSTQAQKLETRLAGGSPSGASAIGPALGGAYTFVEGLAAGARKLVVLITDGPPEVTGSQLVTAASTALASAQGPVNTLAVGVGPLVDQSFMGDLTVAGGMRASLTCDPHATGTTNLCYVQLPNAPQLAFSLQSALASATHLTDCEWQISSATLPATLVVTWSSGGGNPQTIAGDATNGWTLDGTLFTFHGTSCAAIAGASNVDVEVNASCP